MNTLIPPLKLCKWVHDFEQEGEGARIRVVEVDTGFAFLDAHELEIEGRSIR